MYITSFFLVPLTIPPPPPPPLSLSNLSSFSLQRLCTPRNVNCRDMQGRFSTPLHFAAGYNRVEVVEYLLQHRADVTAKDKGWVVAAANVSLAYSAVITRGEVYLCAMCVHFLCQSVPSTTFFQPYNRICPDGATCFMLLPFVTFLPTHTHAHAHAHTPTHAHTHTHTTHTPEDWFPCTTPVPTATMRWQSRWSSTWPT